MRRFRHFLLLLVAAGGLIQGQAEAVPDTRLHVHSQIQRGGVIEDVWTRDTGTRCKTIQILGSGAYPDAMRIGSGVSNLRFVLARAESPETVQLRAWRRAEGGQPAGKHVDLAYTLDPRMRDGEVTGWLARAPADLPPGYLVRLTATWPQLTTCPGERYVAHTYRVGR